MSELTLNAFEQLETISTKGKKNRVKLIKVRKDNEVFCLKTFTSQKFSLIQDALHEAKLLLKASMHHPNICKMFDCFVEQRESQFSFSIVMEYFNHGDLEDEIKLRKQANTPWAEAELLQVYSELIEALTVLQRNRICHRDLKPQNVFSAGMNRFKIGDFGVSKDEMFSNSTDRTLVGTPLYFSPLYAQAYVNLQVYGNENGVRHDMYKSDVFSLGLVFLRMACLANVKGLNIQGQTLINERVSQMNCGGSVKHLISCMLRVNEVERPDFVDLSNVFREIMSPSVPRTIQERTRENVLKTEIADSPCEIAEFQLGRDMQSFLSGITYQKEGNLTCLYELETVGSLNENDDAQLAQNSEHREVQSELWANEEEKQSTSTRNDADLMCFPLGSSDRDQKTKHGIKQSGSLILR